MRAGDTDEGSKAMQYQILKAVENWATSRAKDPTVNAEFRTALNALATAANVVAKYH
jgi:hypothetical protein